MYTILHISDLHRSSSDPITNDELISALLHDRDRYIHESTPISRPDAIIVSGDIIQGVPLGYADSGKELAHQYSVAEEFLVKLCDRFLDGDRSRVIIVPGNHDVDWNVSLSSMQEVADEKILENIQRHLFDQRSLYRWSWKKRALYQIVDPDLYAARLQEYRKFFDRFYSGTSGLFHVSSDSDANTFLLDKERIAVSAFNSCDQNDCFSFHGAINSDVLARCDLFLYDSKKVFNLKIAVWHHNIEGPPLRNDYMDIETVRSLVGKNYRIGLHGHQHKAQVEPQHIYLSNMETMAVVSAGSLCAGQRELPRGVNRQYNIIEISDDYLSAKVHVREMDIMHAFSPARLRSLGGGSHMEIAWTKTLDLFGVQQELNSKQAARYNAIILEAEKHLKSDSLEDVLRLLEPIKDNLENFGKMIYVEALRKSSLWKELILTLENPQSIEELTLLIEAFNNDKQFSQAKKALNENHDAVGMAQPNVLELNRLINMKETLG